MRKIFKFFKVTLITIFVILFLLIAGIFVYFHFFFDLNQYKPLIARIVKEQTGRELAINGNAKLGISLIPTLELEDVAFANASWSEKPYMVQLERLDVQVSILPLLKKEIEIYKVILNKPEIYLEVNEAGQANWDFGSDKNAVLGYKVYAQTESVIIVNDAAVENNAGESKLPISGFFAKNISISQGIVELSNKQTGQNINLIINEVNLSSKNIEDNINLVFDIMFNGEAISGSANVGSVKMLLEAFDPYPVILNAKAYDVTAKVEGSVINPLGKDIHYIMNVDVTNPRGNFGAPNTNFVGTVDGNLKSVKVDIQSLNVENNIITGQVAANIAGKVPSVNAKLNSDLINLMTIMPRKNAENVKLELLSSAIASELVPDTRIPYEFMSMVNADVNLNIAKLIVNDDVALDGLSIASALKDGILDISPLTAKVADGVVNVNANVNASAQTVTARISSDKLVVQNLYKPLRTTDTKKFSIKAGGETELDIDVRTSGATARTLVDNLDGQAIVIVSKSTVNAGELDLLSGNFIGQILDMIKINKTQNLETTLNCAVLRVDLGSGKAKLPSGVAFDTDMLKLSADGDYNLINDKINFTVKPFSGKVSEINLAQAVTSFLKISGTAQNPTVGLDKSQAAQAVVGLATNAAAYAASKVILDAASAPCYTALENTSYADRFPKPSGTAATGQAAIKDVQKAVQAGVNEVRQNVREKAKAAKEDINAAKQNLKKELDAAKDVLNMFKKK